MLVISYDIADDKMRGRFCKMIRKQGAIRLQYSVYEVNNTNRVIGNMLAKIEAYSKHFTKEDSVIIFETDGDKMIKFGNAIHRDKPIVFL